jgi:hypothetical protein
MKKLHGKISSTFPECLDNPPGNAPFSTGRHRHGIFMEPLRLDNLNAIRLHCASGIVSQKTDHLLTGKRPALAPDITNIGNLYPRLLTHFPLNALLQRFPKIKKTGHQTETADIPRGIADQQQFGATPDQDDDTRMNMGEMFLITRRTALAPTGRDSDQLAATA